MKYDRFFVLLCVVLVLAVLPALPRTTHGAQAQPSTADWTFMVYLAADNDLESFALADLNEMEFVGSTDDVNVVVQIDRSDSYDGSNDDWTDARRFFVTHDTSLTQIASEEVATLGEINTGDPASLVDFATWAIDTYPANRYALVIWDHGGSWLGVANDDSAGKDDLSLPELRQALDSITANSGVDQLDLIGFDACLMGGFEVYATIAPYGRYAVSSAELIPGNGWDYLGILDALTAEPSMDGDVLGKAIVDSFITFYTDVVTKYPIFNLSLVDLSLTAPTARALEQVNDAVAAEPDTAFDIISRARRKTSLFGAFNDPQFVDFWAATDIFEFMHLLAALAPDTSLGVAADAAFAAGNDMIVYYRSHETDPVEQGTSIFFPRNQKLYRQNDRADRYVAETPGELAPWQRFLEAFYATASDRADTTVFESKLLEVISTPDDTSFDLDFSRENTYRADVYVNYQATSEHAIVVDTIPLDVDTPGPQTVLLPDEIAWISSRANQLPALVHRDPRHTDQAVVNGTVYPQQGEPFTAQVVFDLTTDESTSLWGLRETSSTLMPFEVDVQPGDIFQPNWIELGSDGTLARIPANQQFDLANWPLTLDWQPAPVGRYQIVVQAEDFAGNIARDEIPGAVGLSPDQFFTSLKFNTKSDWDKDGVLNPADNCMATSNPDQTDHDGDRLGDACDLFDDRDIDQDEMPNSADNCPLLFNPDQLDADGNGTGDACDAVPIVDGDGDGVADDLDNCPDTPNPDQMDSDANGTGDACESQSGSGNDPPDDVQNYHLDGPVTDPAAAQADITNAQLFYGKLEIPPTGYLGPDDHTPWVGFGDDLVMVGSDDFMSGDKFTWGAEFQGYDDVFFYQQYGSGVWWDGGAWSCEFMGPDSDLAVQTQDTFAAYFWDTSFSRLPYLFFELPPSWLSLSGAAGTVYFDADTGVVDVYLIDGILHLSANTSAEYTHTGYSDSALHVRIASDGTVTDDMASLAEALRGIPSDLSTLHIQVQMAHPIPESGADADLAWYLMLDLDANPATGLHHQGIQHMFTGLGPDALVVLRLGDSGALEQLSGGADFITSSTVDGETTNSSLTRVPIDVQLSDDRTTFDINIPVVLLIGAAAELPAPAGFAPEMIRWRVSAINFISEETAAKDVYPEIDIVFPAAALGDVPADVNAGPDAPPAPTDEGTTDTAPSAPAEACTATVNANANLRAGPGTNFDVVGSAAAGQAVTVSGQNGTGDWYQLWFEDDSPPWIAGFLLNNLACPEGVTLPIS